MDNSMKYNLDLLKERILDCTKVSDLENIKKILESIKGNTYLVGSGGSLVTSAFASNVLTNKNKCFTNEGDIVDLMSISDTYDNLFISSYSGNNFGVKEALKLKINKYVLTNGKIDDSNIKLINYLTTLPKEKSFISLGATLLPMSILLYYYLDGINFENIINDIFSNIPNYEFEDDSNFQIFSSNNTKTAERYLDSTLVEAGIGRTTIHHKYNYCHGRSTLLKNYRDTIIYLLTNKTELDETLLDAIYNYKQLFILQSNYNDTVIDDFNLTVQAMFLTYNIALKKNINLSKIDYDKKVIKQLYYFKGCMK